jgi:hypothetical protein
MAAEGGGQCLALSEFFILYGSESLFINGRELRRDQEYAMDYSASRATLAAPLSAGDTLKAFFLRLPLRVSAPVRYLPPAAISETADSAVMDFAPRAETTAQEWLADNTGSVKLGGNKSLAVVVGSGRDLSIEQALQVSVNGRVGQNLELNAYLSDQEMPLSATGSTQELDQLDRVYIQAKSPSWEVTMGDYDLSLTRFRLAGAERQAKGSTASARLGGSKAKAATAVVKAKQAVVRFQGQDGVQGPYQLSADAGRSPKPILANSEKVWLDGQLMRCGQSEDYTIDYQQARLTFTPRRPISDDSRIMAEFQYSEEDFRRSLTGAELDLQVASGLSLGLGYLSDGDDPSRPLLQSLDERQLQLLEEAGDDTAKLWVDGGVPSDSGDYDLIDSVYVYVGRGGNYRVTFTWVGDGAGDYSYRPLLGCYVYVGTGNGSYLARARLIRPERQRLMAVGPRWLWPGGRAEAEGVWSKSDLNLLSSRDDGDNAGAAWCYHLQWSRDTLPWGGFSLSSQAWNVQENFWTGAAAGRQDLASEWGLSGWQGLREQDPLKGRRSYRHEIGYWPGRFIRVGGGYGRLRLDGLKAQNVTAWATVSPWSGWNNTYQRRDIELEGPWFTSSAVGGSRKGHSLGSSLSAGPFKVEAGAGRDDDLIRFNELWERGTRSQQIWAGLRRLLGKGTAGTSFRRQEELVRDSVRGQWAGEWYANTWQNDIKIYPWQFLDAGLEHQSRVKRMRPGAVGLGSRSHLGLLRLGLKPWRQAFLVNADYSLNLTQTQQKREEYYQVPAGTGQYSYDPATGAFYPDTSGNFLRRILDEGPATGTVEAWLRGSASFDPSLVFPASWWTKARLEFSGQAQIKSYRPVTAKLLGFAPSRMWDRWGNAASMMDLAADAWYRWDDWNHHGRLRWRREDDNQFVSRHASQTRLERSWEASAQVKPDLRLSLKAEMSRFQTSTQERGLESRLSPFKMEAELVHQARQNLELNARLEGQREKLERSYRTPSDFNVIFLEYTGEAGTVRHWGLSGSLRLSAGTVRRKADLAREDIPAEYAYTRPLGWTGFWRAQYDYRLNRNLTITAVYEAKDEPERSARHNGRMEIKAYF